MTDKKMAAGCVVPAAGPVAPKQPGGEERNHNPREEAKMSVRVGKEAPYFEAAGYLAGGFKNFKLSDFRGKWVFLCFYPGDFTFV